ncbi:MAG: DUF5908 family protein [Bacteroidales bacterium]|nr:DUF5908 family protein [Bacteroidales bacterium]
MPLEIKELNVVVTVTNNEGRGNSSQAQQAGGSAAPANADAIVAQCVEQVLEILKEREER